MIAAVVIASGFSTRMGRSKLDLELGGESFLARAIRAASLADGVERCLVVVRPGDEDKLVAFVPGLGSAALNPRSAPPGTSVDNMGAAPIVGVLNPHAHEGQSASIRLAVAELNADPEIEAVIFSVVDQPFLTSSVFETLVGAWHASPDSIFVSSYAGQRGNPALFPRRFFGELLDLTGDVGGRDVIRRHPEAVHEVAMPNANAGRDVDTWEDYLEAQRQLAG